jgi:hypothetical protein
VRAAVFVKPTTVVSWHHKRWMTLEETSVALASPANDDQISRFRRST